MIDELLTAARAWLAETPADQAAFYSRCCTTGAARQEGVTQEKRYHGRPGAADEPPHFASARGAAHAGQGATRDIGKTDWSRWSASSPTAFLAIALPNRLLCYLYNNGQVLSHLLSLARSVGPAFHVSASPAYDFAVDHSFEWAVHWPQPRKIKTLLLAPPRVGIESGARAGDSPLPLTGPRAALLLRARGCSTPVVLDRSPFAAKASRVASTFVHGRHFLQHLLLCQCFWGALLQGLKFLVFGIDVSGLAAVVSLPWHPAVQLIG